MNGDATGGDDSIERRIALDLDSLRRTRQFRSLHIPEGIDLSSNDYLGLARDPRLKEAVIESVQRVGRMGASGSRLLSGNAREWQELETEFAEFAGTEAALYFGSGYAANLGLLTSLLKPGDVVFSDAMNHASLIDGMRLSGARKVIYKHCDLADLEGKLRENAARSAARVIVTETVFSMEGDVAPLDSILRVAGTYGAAVVIDEAHATGAMGPQGRGVAAALGIERELLAVVHTCGKALASAGAFVCCGQDLKEYLVNRARTFVFSTAMPPYFALQIRAAVQLARGADREREHLRRIASELRSRLKGARIDHRSSSTHIVPVILGSSEAALHAASELQRAGFAAKAIRPPTVPDGTARIRVSLTSRVTMEQTLDLADALRVACESARAVQAAGAAHG
jgi:8-amino-7-oxononanoate synthase